MVDLTKILKDAPKGTKLYSPIFGEVVFEELINPENEAGFSIKTTFDGRNVYFTKYGRYLKSGAGECMLFPSKDNMSWEDVSFKPARPDLPSRTPMVTFITKPSYPQELRLMFYDKNGHCFAFDGEKERSIKTPHAIPLDKFNLETLSWDPADDYGILANTTCTHVCENMESLPTFLKKMMEMLSQQ
jgi:hypothetical protein